MTFATFFWIAVFTAGVIISYRGRPKPQHPIFADEKPPHVPTNPDQLHHDDRRNAYLSRLNQWYESLNEQERAEFDKKLAEKLSAYSKSRTTQRFDP